MPAFKAIPNRCSGSVATRLPDSVSLISPPCPSSVVPLIVEGPYVGAVCRVMSSSTVERSKKRAACRLRPDAARLCGDGFGEGRWNWGLAVLGLQLGIQSASDYQSTVVQPRVTPPSSTCYSRPQASQPR